MMISQRLFILVLNVIVLLKLSNAETLCTEFNPCKNLADCLMRDTDPSRVRCVCKRGFSGNLCEKWPRVCSNDFCFNGGTCVLLKRIPRCMCQSEFKGLFCENLTFPSKNSGKINSIEINQQNNSIEAYKSFNQVQYTTAKTSSLRSDLPPIEFFTSPHTVSTPIENINSPFLTNPFVTDQVEFKNNDVNPFFNFEKVQPTEFLETSSQGPAVNLPISTGPSSFMTFEYPKEIFIKEENAKISENNNFLTEPSNQSPSICSFDPCLNYGKCMPITDSLFKFRCICPENFTGILCENSDITKNTKQKEITNDFNYLSDTEPLNFTENLKVDISSTTIPSTTTSTTTTPTTTTSTTPNAFTTTVPIEFSSTSHRDFAFIRNQKKYSICTQLRPCANNGQCVDVENYNEGMQRFRCICKSEFTGIFCHIKLNRRKVNACTYNSCLNSGECIPNNNSFSCVCPPTFTGKFCELNSY